MYTTQYNFDSFGRLHTVTNPDGEVITNSYDTGGNLKSIEGRLNGHPYKYLERLDYDKFEQRVYMKAGNGVVTKYAYRPDNRRLQTLKAGLPGKDWMQDMTYGYDLVGNIKSLIDSAPIPKSNVYGGKSTQTFEYDDLYRLVKADGVYTTAREEQTYTLAMVYDTIHNITHKNQLHTVGKVGGTSPKTETATTYDWGYTYGGGEFKQPHAPTHIGERTFDYDANGNQRGWQNDTNGSRRTIVWDEENRIREVQDPKHGAAFSYDDKGERKLRKSQYGETAYINQYFSVRNGAIASTHVYAGTSRIVTKVGAGTPVGKVTTTIQGTGNLTDTGTTMGDVIVITADGTTTTGSATTTATTTTTPSPQRGEGGGEGQTATGNFPGQGLEHRSDRANEVARNTEKNKHLNGGIPGGEHGADNSNKGGHTSNSLAPNGGEGRGEGAANGGGNGNGQDNSGGGQSGGNTGGGTGTGDGMEFIYFYHPDHLGSTGYVTDEKAQRYEHITYFPFGETWVQEATATWRVPYQFTSKEMDPETGLYYFGARYYDPRTSVWQSVDPALPSYLEGAVGMGGVYRPINVNLYRYASLNPLIVTDPDGRTDVYSEDGTRLQHINDKANTVVVEHFKWSNLLSLKNPKVRETLSKPQSDSFNEYVGTVAAESSGNLKESKGIADVINNRASLAKRPILDILRKTGIYGNPVGRQVGDRARSSKTEAMKNARAGVIDVMIGGSDDSGGAYFWEGLNFLQSPNNFFAKRMAKNPAVFVETETYGRNVDNNVGTKFMMYNPDHPRYGKQKWP